MNRRGKARRQPVKTRRRKTTRSKARKATASPELARGPQKLPSDLARERDEALHQQAATTEILKLISSSPADTQPVFEAIVRSGLKLFPDAAIFIALPDGDKLRATAFAEADPVRAKAWKRRWPVPLTREYIHGVAFLDRKLVDIADGRDVPSKLAAGAKNFLASGYRAVTVMPMMRGRTAIGTLSVVRLAPGKLSNRQIAALKTYAAQAVIAIENTRVLNELRQRTDDLSESLEQQTATSEVLKVISNSVTELQTVFDTMAENAVKLCEAERGYIFRFDGEFLRAVANYNAGAENWEFVHRHPIAPGRQSVSARAALERRTVHVADIQADPEYEYVLRDVEPIRTTLAVPMLKGGELVGTITIYRLEVRPFTDKQIALVETFAAQAVIAIENARLLNELRERTDDLSESLEQQTATSEVLKIISSSPGDLKPVFQAMLEQATRICDAKFGIVFRYDGGLFHPVASLDLPPALADFMAEQGAFAPQPGQLFGRLYESKTVVNVVDRATDPNPSPSFRYGGARSSIAVPMLKDNELVGALFIYRTEVRPFTDKQVGLVKNFAAQAVIAIENARLLNELRQRTDDLSESLEQQTATSEVLQVISKSPGDLEPVFQAMLQNAVRICEAKFGVLFRHEDGGIRQAAMLNVPVAHANSLRERGRFRPEAGHPLDRVLRTKKLVHTVDAAASPNPPPSARLGAARSHLAVPMLKDEELIGAIVIYRQEVRPFTEKQIELVQNFAAQAVIAIENARLLNELHQRTDDLSESLEQQTATSEVLGVISGSVTDAQPVFDMIAESAARLCDAQFSFVYRFDGQLLHFVAHRSLTPEVLEINRRAYPASPNRNSVASRAILERRVVQIPDVGADPEYGLADMAALAGYRSAVAVPIMRDGVSVGCIAVTRAQVGLLPDRQVDLLKIFADQAVIAIENVRLFDEVQARTEELSESLEQQTATAEVLKVISSSQGDLEPVFQAMLENAVRICEASYGNMWLCEGEDFRAAALHGPLPPAFIEKWQVGTSFRPGPEILSVRALKIRQPLQVADLRADQSYLGGDPLAISGVEEAGMRTVVAVPMLKENRAVGVIVIYRKEVRAFTDKQITLLSNFADQAVIAIENARLLSELRESLQQQTATADVLTVISSSPGTLDPVFSTMLAKATELCEASYSTLWLHEGDGFRTAAIHGDLPPAWIEQWRSGAIYRPGPDRPIARATEERRPIQVADMRADPSYLQGDSLPVAGVEIAGIRTLLIVPMFKESEPVGVIAIYRKEVLPFTDKQIELVQNFAAQAVIAIENTRLLNELRERTDDLSASLEQQTATSEVLKVISSSPGDLESVFTAMLENATRVCEARHGFLFRAEGDGFRVAAILGDRAPFIEQMKNRALTPGPLTPIGRVKLTHQIVHVPDLSKDQGYLERDPLIVTAVEQGAVRSVLIVPMLKDGELVGAIGMHRREVRPFTDKQIELLTNFAAQAVIAIENTRLLNELRESLQQQTATSDVLKVISRSTFDLETVLSTLAESATKLCEADGTIIWRPIEGRYRLAASYGLSPKFETSMRQLSLKPEGHSVVGRTLQAQRTRHIPDMSADPEYAGYGSERMGGYRGILGVPLLREGVAIGVMMVGRLTPKAFTEPQIALVTTFADQAVIAIENVRLFDDVQKRTQELTESLQQQTATADVLKVISRSTFDLQTVLQTLVESAATLCNADKTIITRQKDGAFYRAEAHGLSREFMDHVRNIPIAAERGSAFGRALLESRPVHIPDVKADPEYTSTEMQKLGDYRTVLAVPMLREGAAIGVLTLLRSEVGPFTERQIELASTFADQAAIAIENVRLFDAVQGRTRELAASLDNLRTTQDRLVQTQKLASLGQLTAGIAHEIKNPLNFVNNFSSISSELVDELQDVVKGLAVDDKARGQIGELTDMLRGNLEKVVQHGKRADGIVKNMLLHSREGSGEHRLVDINALVEESLNLAYHGARAETQGFNVTLERALDPAAGEADVFPQDITRVLINLISNGFYAATRRKAQAGDGFEPTLAASTRTLGDRVEIRIRDNGTGIPPDVREKIFNPFFTTKPAGEGTGLGLSISHDIVVKQHAGAIEVDTQPGAFTEIRIILPRKGAFPG